MDESMFETFEEELKTLQDVPPQKPLRQARRPEVYAQRRLREESQTVHQIPRAPSCEASATRSSVFCSQHLSKNVPLRKTLSIENVAQIEVPWEGVTLNRCLLVAITILILTSSCHRLLELVRGRKDKTDVETLGNALNLRYSAVRKGRLLPPEPEASLWETFFWWVNDDDTNRCKSRKAIKNRTYRDLRHKAAPTKKLLKRREQSFKSRREKAKRDERESLERVKQQTEKEKRRKQKKLEGEKEKEVEEDKIANNTKESKGKVTVEE